MSISRNWPQLCLDNISDKEKISKGLFPHQTSYQHLEVRYHLTVIKKLQGFVSSSNFLPALGGKIPFDGNKENFKGLFPHQTSYQHLEVRYHLTVIKKLQRFVSSSNFLPALGGKIPFDGNKETSKVCFLIKLLTSTWR